MKEILDVLNQMRTKKIRNYVIPGLTSTLIEGGVIRLFENSRAHQERITPHSHRFDHSGIVLSGSVFHKMWYKDPNGDDFTYEWKEYIVVEIDFFRDHNSAIFCYHSFIIFLKPNIAMMSLQILISIRSAIILQLWKLMHT